MAARHWLLLLVTAAAFASSLTFNKMVAGAIPPLSVAALRALLAAPVVIALQLLLRVPLAECVGHARTVLVGACLLVAVPYSAIAWGQTEISSGLGGVIYGALPVMAVLAAHVALPDERMTAGKATGIVAAMAGLLVIFGAPVQDNAAALEGKLVTLLAPLSFACGMVYLRRRPAVDPIALVGGMLAAAAVILLPVAAVIEPWRSVELSGAVALPLIGLALIGSACPAYLNYVLIRRVGASRASLAMFFIPLFALAFGGAFLAEAAGLETLAGMALILGGSLLVARSGAAPDSR